MAQDCGAKGHASPAAVTAWFVDTHCHLERYRDARAEVAAARAAGVVVVAVSELPSRFQREEVRYRNEHIVRAAIGVHPLSATRATPAEMSLWRTLIDRTDYVGEIGLDGSEQGKSSLGQQRRVFEAILSHHAITSKVLTVHSRRAEAEVVESLAAVKARAILHWYSGSMKALHQALDAGLYFSINPAMLKSKSGQRVLAALPRDRVLTETDGPYTKRGARPSAPSDIPWLVSELAAIWSVERDEARHIVFENMSRLYGRLGDDRG